MKGKKIALGLSIVFLGSLFSSRVSAQSESDIDFSVSGDLVSSYIWRGFKQAGASVQPALSISTGGFTLGAWGSTDIASDGKKEVDFYASYNVGPLQLTVTDYWWDGEGAHRYFSYPNDEFSGHLLETSLEYTFSESFPLTVAWNTFVLGKGNKKENGDNSFSTYIELSYPFSVKDVDLKISTGFIPWKSAVYGPDMDKFKFTSIQFGASKEVKITDSFSVPLYANIIANPAVEDIYFVFGITLK